MGEQNQTLAVGLLEDRSRRLTGTHRGCADRGTRKAPGMWGQLLPGSDWCPGAGRPSVAYNFGFSKRSQESGIFYESSQFVSVGSSFKFTEVPVKEAGSASSLPQFSLPTPSHP